MKRKWAEAQLLRNNNKYDIDDNDYYYYYFQKITLNNHFISYSTHHNTAIILDKGDHELNYRLIN